MARRRVGFTLLEMLIALGVFAVIGVMSSQILSGIVDLSDTVPGLGLTSSDRYLDDFTIIE